MGHCIIRSPFCWIWLTVKSISIHFFMSHENTLVVWVIGDYVTVSSKVEVLVAPCGNPFQPFSKMRDFFLSWRHWHDASIESLDFLRPMALWSANPPARSAASEAHRAMAIAMNRIGGKSNTGEGGEEQNVVWMFCLNNLWSPSLLLMPSEPWKKLELFGVYIYIYIVLRSIGGILIIKPLWNPSWPTSSVECFFV